MGFFEDDPPESSNPPPPDDSQRIRLPRLLEHQGEVIERLDRLEALVVKMQRREDRRDGAARIMRLVVGAAASIGLSMGAAALSLARDASSDHGAVTQHEDRITRVEHDARTQEREVTTVLGDLRTDLAETKVMLRGVSDRVDRIDANVRRDRGPER